MARDIVAARRSEKLILVHAMAEIKKLRGIAKQHEAERKLAGQADTWADAWG